MAKRTPPVLYVNAVVALDTIHDGDTFDVTIDLGRGTFRKISVRLVGLDTPEVTGDSKLVGVAVRNAVYRWLREKPCAIESKELDKYGRSLAVLRPLDGSEALNDYLVRTKMAKPYDGKTARSPWTQTELAAAEKAAAAENT